MPVILEGEYSYQEEYMVEHEEAFYGPFGGVVQATTFALERFDPPFTLRPLLKPIGVTSEGDHS